MATTEFNYGFGLECLGIVCYNISRETKSSKDIGFQEIHDHLTSIILGGNSLDPFGKGVSGSENLLVLPTGGWIYLTYEI
jgi:hypothetical protein